MKRCRCLLVLVVPLVCLLTRGASRLKLVEAADEPGKQTPALEAQTQPGTNPVSKAWTTAVPPKPLSSNAKKGLDWLVEHQLADGGWGEGEESTYMRDNSKGRDSLRDTANVADTCVAALALLRSGSNPREGPYRGAIAKAVGFVRAQVEQSDADSLSVTRVQGTRVQLKLGPNIDTFLASMLLAEVKAQMPDAVSTKAVDLALAKVLHKIERHQKADGSFEGHGWAPILAQAMCGKGINRARQAGFAVPEMVLARAENSAKLAFQAASPTRAGASMDALPFSGSTVADGSVRASARAGAMAGAALSGDAGVELYRRAASVGVLQDSVNTSKLLITGLREQATSSKDKTQRDAAQQKLQQIAETESVQHEAQRAVIARLDDKQFVAGFGSNGGEEFLSYMNIAESLVVKGGDDWKKWDSEMTANLNRVQDSDGSWSGHHCITGRTFCTSTALLVLMADRTPIPMEARKERKELPK
jgi:hypothetical protein